MCFADLRRESEHNSISATERPALEEEDDDGDEYEDEEVILMVLPASKAAHLLSSTSLNLLLVSRMMPVSLRMTTVRKQMMMQKVLRNRARSGN